MKFRPFIAMTDGRRQTVERFIASYKQSRRFLARPVVYYKGDSPWFKQAIESLRPELMIEQPDDRFQYNICHDLPGILFDQFEGEPAIFMEDDILFSSHFARSCAHVLDRMRRYDFVDAVTFYGNGDCYWPGANDANFLYKFNGHDYYGNLCFAMSPKVVKWWYKNRTAVWKKPVWGWDIKIGQAFQDAGLNWYCTHSHFVQHQIGPSVIDGVVKKQQSNRFVP